ncbi:M14 family zinc carboxypeptidase [Piscibacillus halophilus]|uniref:M14 family zinc carboxypeptidase n=1 Tax=Piscibacillus halophilus TaxID=571933 RepID=UPI002409BB17|nr:M14 family zinc carboxypeptidase [Piscibacillus halophilus]
MSKKRKRFVWLCSSVLVGASLLMPSAASADMSPGTPDQQIYSVSGFVDHDELSQKLQQIEQTSHGELDLEVAGYSNQGLEIYKATVGHGDKVVMIQSEIHGNEKTGTVALVNMLKQIATNNSPKYQQLREELTIIAVPMMNPDASEANRRGNELSWDEVVQEFPQLEEASPSWNYYTYVNEYWDYASNPGFDVNRDFNPDLNYEPQASDFPGNSASPGWFITPEAQTVRDIYKEAQEEFGNVDVFIDLHHQGQYYVEGTEDEVTLSLSGVFVPDPNTDEGEKYSEYQDVYDGGFAKQLNVAAYDALQDVGNSIFNHISLYPQDLDLPGTALGSFALNGSGSVLFEVTGQTQNFGQKKKGQLVKAVETGLYGIIESVADQSVYDIDPSLYDEIPATER